MVFRKANLQKRTDMLPRQIK